MCLCVCVLSVLFCFVDCCVCLFVVCVLFVLCLFVLLLGVFFVFFVCLLGGAFLGCFFAAFADSCLVVVWYDVVVFACRCVVYHLCVVVVLVCL